MLKKRKREKRKNRIWHVSLPLDPPPHATFPSPVTPLSTEFCPLSIPVLPSTALSFSSYLVQQASDIQCSAWDVMRCRQIFFNFACKYILLILASYVLLIGSCHLGKSSLAKAIIQLLEAQKLYHKKGVTLLQNNFNY